MLDEVEPDVDGLFAQDRYFLHRRHCREEGKKRTPVYLAVLIFYALWSRCLLGADLYHLISIRKI